jgi:hypothetical protein
MSFITCSSKRTYYKSSTAEEKVNFVTPRGIEPRSRA